jgi:hypothetical protein
VAKGGGKGLAANGGGKGFAGKGWRQKVGGRNGRENRWEQKKDLSGISSPTRACRVRPARQELVGFLWPDLSYELARKELIGVGQLT